MPDSGGSIDVGACHICEDKATGKHYGAISCDGCKGFFRRSIRKSHNYVCRFDHRCQVDKNHRNGCRACRLQKCIIAGMKSAAIQNERDLIGKRKKPCSSSGEEEFLELLLRSEKMCQQLRSSVIKSTEQASYDCGKVTNAWSATDERQRRATINDVGKSIHQQLVLLVEWAKSLPHFNQLDVVDKACLLKHNAAQVIVLGVAFRSLAADDAICLANDALLPREHANQVGDINGAVNRILDELVAPMRRLAVDFCECVALKATLFFNPVARGVSDVDRVEEARACCLRALERRCMGRGDCRFGRLLLLLPPLHAVAQQLVEDVQLARVFGLANVDSLMQELILHDDSSDPQLINTLAATIKQE